MTRPIRKQWMALLLLPALISLACGASAGGLPGASAADELTVQRNMVFGSGPFNFIDPRAGLADLAGYKATLTITFDGTNAGQTTKWSAAYSMLASRDPAAKQLNIEKSGNISNLDPVFRAEMDGTDYERIGNGPCSTSAIAQGSSLGDRMEPAGILNRRGRRG